MLAAAASIARFALTIRPVRSFISSVIANTIGGMASSDVALRYAIAAHLLSSHGGTAGAAWDVAGQILATVDPADEADVERLFADAVSAQGNAAALMNATGQ